MSKKITSFNQINQKKKATSRPRRTLIEPIDAESWSLASADRIEDRKLDMRPGWSVALVLKAIGIQISLAIKKIGAGDAR
jgi:hypothetical protein